MCHDYIMQLFIMTQIHAIFQNMVHCCFVSVTVKCNLWLLIHVCIYIYIMLIKQFKYSYNAFLISTYPFIINTWFHVTCHTNALYSFLEVWNVWMHIHWISYHITGITLLLVICKVVYLCTKITIHPAKITSYTVYLLLKI